MNDANQPPDRRRRSASGSLSHIIADAACLFLAAAWLVSCGSQAVPSKEAGTNDASLADAGAEACGSYRQPCCGDATSCGIDLICVRSTSESDASMCWTPLLMDAPVGTSAPFCCEFPDGTVMGYDTTTCTAQNTFKCNRT